MKIKLEEYQIGYHKNGKFIDNWQSGIKLLPFVSNTTSVLDRCCPLQGVSGEFFRLAAQDNTYPIEDPEEEIRNHIIPYLCERKKMKAGEMELFLDVLRDILYISGNLNITDSSFMKYVPLMPADENTAPKERAKRVDGQRKAARYLYDMLGAEPLPAFEGSRNLFSRILHDALAYQRRAEAVAAEKAEYKALAYIQKSFKEDLQWLLAQEDVVRVRYLHVFFHFYLCYAITQTLVCLSAKRVSPCDAPEMFYFILSSERVSVNHEAVEKGWPQLMSKHKLDRLYGHAQALDIVNCVLGGNVGFYPEVLAALQKTPFEENKEALEQLLISYQSEKKARLGDRKSENGIARITRADEELHPVSYEDFLIKLEQLCVEWQSTSYISRMRKKVIDVMSMRFLKRGRGHYVLSLDDEMFLFLTAMLTRGEKTQLEALYKRFEKYGMRFNRETKSAMEQYLLKLNLLDRKSDSGEAQYVRVVL